MAFRFELATLLRLREIAEQKEERLLEETQIQISRTCRILDELALQRQNLLIQRERCMVHPTTAIEVQSYEGASRRIMELDAKGRVELAKLQALRGRQMEEYKAAYARRELLTAMRKAQRETYEYEQTRRNQSIMDDNFSCQRKRS